MNNLPFRANIITYIHLILLRLDCVFHTSVHDSHPIVAHVFLYSMMWIGLCLWHWITWVKRSCARYIVINIDIFFVTQIKLRLAKFNEKVWIWQSVRDQLVKISLPSFVFANDPFPNILQLSKHWARWSLAYICQDLWPKLAWSTLI